MKTNYRIFGAWRLLAAMLVMAYHFSHYAVNAEVVTAWFAHMLPLLDMFFIMSGFLIFEHYRDMDLSGRGSLRFLGKRLARLYPLHIITLSIFVAFAVLVHLGVFHSEGAHTRYDLSALPANLLLVQAWGFTDELTFNYVSWSLSGEWFAYLLFPALLLVFRRAGLAGLLAVLLAAIIGLEWSDRNAQITEDFWYVTRAWGAYRVGADFVMGAILCAIVHRFRAPAGSQPIAWGTLVLVFWAMFADADIYLTLGLFAVAITFAAFADRTGTDRTRWLEPLMPFAAVSFGIYMWHPVVELFAYSLIWKRLLGGGDIVAFWLYIPLPMMAAVVVSLVSARYLERPMGKRIDRLFDALLAPRKAAAPGL
ncbi:acyltransferase [Pseudohoeflea suaedae]|uniref:Acyltransferase n=1 Tax=Pseudohoeflea suaedae TaxID=877384 RepID=A0A4V3A790_9HYPH|nr:acyltransferase [Pseudohoeflea suaedae]TDH37875.1 acyltransferase [Pseudohoeflea suaedae]